MARRKAPKTSKRKAAGAGKSRARRAKASASRRAAVRRTKTARKASRPRKAAARKRTVKRTVVISRKKVAARKVTARKTTARKTTARKTTARKATASKPAVKRTRPARQAAPAPVRKVPALDRARRIVTDEEVFPTPPSSLDLDRTASAARSGRRELRDKFREHTETGPTLTGGDIDADWESASTVGDEAPGGDNPTPDQDIVDDIGRALGVEYEDNEELKSEKKISDRDRKRWELDPASSEDYEDR